MAEENEGSGTKKAESRSFKVTDRRSSSSEDAPPDGEKPAVEPEVEDEKAARAPDDHDKGSAESKQSAGQRPPTPIPFTTFIFSLSSSALIQLGEIPDPITKKTDKDLDVAQQTIDLLGLLQEKTKGNLTEEESDTLESALYDLRMRFLKAAGRI